MSASTEVNAPPSAPPLNEPPKQENNGDAENLDTPPQPSTAYGSTAAASKVSADAASISESSSMDTSPENGTDTSKKRSAGDSAEEAKGSSEDGQQSKKAKTVPTPIFDSERVELFRFDFDEHFEAMAEMQGNALVMEQFANAQPRKPERVARQARVWHDRWHSESPPKAETAFMGGYAMYLKPSATGLSDRLFFGTVVTGGSSMPNSAECAICCQAAYFPDEKRYASSKADLVAIKKELGSGNKRGVVPVWGLRIATEVGQLMHEKHLPLFKKAHPNIKTIDSTASNPASQKILDRLGFRKISEKDARYGEDATKNAYILDLY